MSKYGLGDLHQALRTYLQSGFDAGQVVEAGNVPAPFLRANRTWVPGIWIGCYVQITDGAGIGQFQEIFDNSNNEIFLVDPWTIAPDTTSVFKIMPPPPGLGTASPVQITNTSDLVNLGGSVAVCAAADTSGGITVSIENFRRWSLYVRTVAVIQLTVFLSPDNGVTFFDVGPPDSPLVFAAAGDNIFEFGFDATHIRLVGNNATAVTAIIRGIY